MLKHLQNVLEVVTCKIKHWNIVANVLQMFYFTSRLTTSVQCSCMQLPQSRTGVTMLVDTKHQSWSQPRAWRPRENSVAETWKHIKSWLTSVLLSRPSVECGGFSGSQLALISVEIPVVSPTVALFTPPFSFIMVESIEQVKQPEFPPISTEIKAICAPEPHSTAITRRTACSHAVCTVQVDIDGNFHVLRFQWWSWGGCLELQKL